eukprot:5757683-Alexandrium_andersonii.AAC.1
MSASLVGSEMCIRDSDLPRWSGCSVRAVLSARDLPLQSWPLGGRGAHCCCLLYTSDAADDM